MFVNYLIGVFVFVLGLCVGSFLNCCIYRLEKNKKITGRSFCPKCKHKLSWQDLFPVFSFLFLQGKCRYCSKKISWQYPVVELMAGFLFVFVFCNLGFVSDFGFRISDLIALCFMFYVSSSMIVIFVYDLKHYLIPDKVLFPAIIITFIYQLFSNFFLLGGYLLAVLIASGFFLTIFLISRGKWMGFGDVKLAVLMGLLLGFPNIFVALFLAFFFGAIIGLILMAFKKKGLKSEIPFGPFLIIGTFIVMFCGSQIIQWYLNFFQI